MPPVDRVKYERSSQTFLQAPRFSPIKGDASTSSASASLEPNGGPRDSVDTIDNLPSVKKVGPAFGTEVRFKETINPGHAVPGPGHYDVLRLFDMKDIYDSDSNGVGTPHPASCSAAAATGAATGALAGAEDGVQSASCDNDNGRPFSFSSGLGSLLSIPNTAVSARACLHHLTGDNVELTNAEKVEMGFAPSSRAVSRGTSRSLHGLGQQQQQNDDVDDDDGRPSRPNKSRGESRGSTVSSKSNPLSKKLEALVTKHITDKRTMLDERSQDLSQIVGFGFGCSKEEHILYGMCLDRLCGRRAPWETTMITTSDYSRACGFSDSNNKYMHNYSMKGKTPFYDVVAKKRDQKIQNLVASEFADIIDEPVQHLSPIYVAAFRNDLESIEKLMFRGDEVNNIEPHTGYSALHIATIRCLPKAVEKLLEVFHGRIDVNIVDVNRDTPLHVAAKLGFKEIVSMLCDAGADPRKCYNLKKQLPLDLSKDHPIFSIIKLTLDSLNLKDELKSINASVREVSRASRSLKDGFISGTDFVGVGGAGVTIGGQHKLDRNRGSPTPPTELELQEMRWGGGGGGVMQASRYKTVEGSDKVERTHSYDSNEFPKNVMGDNPQEELDDSSPVKKGFSRKKLTKYSLKNPRNNTFMIGYWQETAENDDSKPKSKERSLSRKIETNS